ncbi:hypothetical protein CWO85_00670 [Candidatus Phytoplasma ziziphi]|uniref:Uncharacterized protein n=1 Tax=Ziziphus jujuba witches'-broom phytoplasma TaxID=135727 RepID=A0A660HLX9_ZIZJU|nr:hypothetical protein [Candidatus Phytoplasma ziziphi]AYJ01053.1 hypothetical protein CWO85_00670 [Candidatus Phytoplasma ziziphi]
MNKISLRKIIIISFLISMSLIMEFILTKPIFGANCQNSLIKLELLPLLLIGFFFGFKYSILSNLLFVLIHIILESSHIFHGHNLLKEINHDKTLIISILLFLFIIPYIACSLTGLFRSSHSNNLCKNKDIVNSLLLITVIQIISYAIFSFIFYPKTNSNHILKHIFHDHDDGGNIVIFLYFFFSIIITNLIISICIFFIKKFVKENEIFLF